MTQGQCLVAETWLSPNRRVLILALVPAILLAAIGALVYQQFTMTIVRWTGGGLTVLGLLLAGGLLRQMRRPRISYYDQKVWFHLRAGLPLGVPAEVVEAFFLGQGPAHLPGESTASVNTVNLVARLSQRAPEWAEQNVKAALGNWSDSYVTIRGAWCEPLNNDVVRRLNRRLKQVHEQPLPPEDLARSSPAEDSNQGAVRGAGREG